MSAWEVYWLMQADTICLGAPPTFIITGLAGLLLVAFMYIECEKHVLATLLGFLCVLSIAIGVAIGLFMPSTKTLAAMYAVPLVVNNEQLQSDLTDVYTLGMERLKEVLETEKSK